LQGLDVDAIEAEVAKALASAFDSSGLDLESLASGGLGASTGMKQVLHDGESAPPGPPGGTEAAIMEMVAGLLQGGGDEGTSSYLGALGGLLTDDDIREALREAGVVGNVPGQQASPAHGTSGTERDPPE